MVTFKLLPYHYLSDFKCEYVMYIHLEYPFQFTTNFTPINTTD
jgi:hypothetical protein